MTSPRCAPDGTPERCSLWRIPLPHSPAAVPLARAMIRDLLAEPARAEGFDCDTAELLTAEVVTNAVEHTPGGPIELIVELLARGFQVEVHDPGREVPAGFTRLIPIQSVAPDAVPLESLAEGGRGLLLIRTLSASSGCRLTGSGKAVWFILS
ncbi:Anti-sigma regulatory factor (Ser/Thr protein kinase) [Streptomyces sp. DvalAA-14]|uniref:ATP-binding protein n=1 Tax=unclassified Streptomyces TaxID=2593676 RepID=UPI00081BAEA7|nr:MULTISPECIES: ATP-binding protein [unclassified Streptomyces]MYS19822.1 ATP-binding protein [Streptomyces sp. SID4948]SCD54135.1 Anti-sigma regulatory factor (Ser/Thr protein kinase) [Streptomyces sp. DvalAA-14]